MDKTLYVYAALLIFIGLLILYLLLKNRDDEEHNLMEDVPTISVNKEDLENHAIQISQYYSTVSRRSSCRRKLIKSLDKSYSDILKAYEYIDKDVKYKREVVPAAEWMLDNLYLIEKEYKDIKHNMPESYYKGLPVINKGILKGYPRIYHIAVELVSHTDGRVDEKTIDIFINAYQKNTILTIGELWALPIMIRIALIQNVSKISEKIINSLKEKKIGEKLAEKLINAYNNENVEEELNRISEENSNISSHFVERFLKVIRDNGIDSPEIYKWIDEKLELQELSTEKMIAFEHQRQAAFQISIGNSITSLREVEAIDWKEAFEKLSFVEKILRNDPVNIYVNMDFDSRDSYRHMIEKIAKYSKNPEVFVAKKALECSQKAEGTEQFERHIGYYLIDDGLNQLKEAINLKENGLGRFKKLTVKRKVGLYIGTILCLTLLLCLAVIAMVRYENNNSVLWQLVVGALTLLIPCSEIVISIFNWSINHLSAPRFVPKMEFKEGIPEESSTIVVIPTLLNNERRVHELTAEMEVYYLANMGKNLYFALLGDFKDCSKEHDESDSRIVEAAILDIKSLNERYAENGEDIFYFFNRYRQYNEKEGIWLGWERKRGKLMEFNELLRGNKNTSYNVTSGDVEKLSKIKYVITLDADTQLPRDTAKKLIGAMSHVLNKPHLDYRSKRVLRGYGLMQPRVSVGTVAANKTMFSKIF